jgi:hypothetical protein
MDDLIERLKLYSQYPTTYNEAVRQDAEDAAAEITRLRAQIEVLNPKVPHYRAMQEEIAKRYNLPIGHLQMQWRDGLRSDRSELEYAICDALAQGCIHAWPGDGVSCVAQIVDAKQREIDAIRAEVKAARKEGSATHRHVKTGGDYEKIGVGRIQSSTPLNDMQEVVIYKSMTDGSLWAREAAEFNDVTRFRPLNAAAIRALAEENG